MIICSAQELSKMFGGNLIFENLSFEIPEGARIGLVGRNGTGKTTIFKLLSGAETPDTGMVHLKKGAKVGYLAQIPQFPEGTKGLDVLKSAFSSLLRTGERLKELESRMGNEGDPDKLNRLLEEYGKLQDEFTLSGGYEIDANIAKISNGLEINELLEKDFNQCSGGEQTKLCLGLILLQKPDLLLLDEPTNHLDIGAVEWLEDFLKEYEGTVLCISHDRYFLDHVINKVFDLEDGEVTIYHSNYSGFVKEKEERLLLEFQAYQEQQKKIKKMKEAIKRLKEWANQANPPNEALHKRARNMERALERMEKIKRPILERKKMGLEFEETDRSGKVVFSMKDVTKSFDDRALFTEADLLVHFKDRTAIVGQNGTGKSTIINMLLGNETCDSGEVKLGSNVKLGYLSQHFTIADPDARLIDAFREEVAVTEGDARHILAKFLFYGPNVFRKVGQLSGGEKMRLRLAQLMHQDINFLVLDEPTNHLDIDSREVLEEALEDFKGTILAVSHDRYFLNKLFHKTYWIHDRKLYSFEGPYSWAKEKLAELAPHVSTEVEAPKKKPAPMREKEERPKPSISIEEVEKDLEELEGKIGEIEDKLLSLTELDALQELYSEKESLEKQRDEKYDLLEECL
ncbi:ribosomal protection-like ABC-F family protein [[Bacillus] enclensis]|uniref:ribosomal protection-like ABC-F family protein n=1 Tax=[Bacillus] enclensis TaxID=1402860 RepID=UPI0018DB9D7C|nr:ABC-F family ATP-binding cassette domain-containing protein [[Bacillus] enclensis]MBH9967203.1 ABC-F family ATP-binding cassette domain-containing protein [[Bacillus] enclensis]QWC23305.1 ATP-binding cassette domain-containing protein [Bacillus haikouensis]